MHNMPSTMLLKHVVPDQLSGNTAHQHVCGKMLLAEDPRQAYSCRGCVDAACTHFDGYSPAMTAATGHANVLCDDGKEPLVPTLGAKNHLRRC